MAITAIVALAVGALVAVGSSGGDTLPPAEPFSLAAAAQNTVDARSVEFDLTVGVGDLGDIAVVGAIDNETKLVSVSTDLSALLSLDPASPLVEGGGDGGGDGSIELLFDASTGVVYISAEALGELLPGDSAWVSADLGVLAEESGASLDEIRDALLVDPAEVARMLLDSDNVVEVGSETVDGVDTVHYEVTVDVADAIAAVPQAESKLDEAGVDLPDLPDDGHLRRLGHLRQSASTGVVRPHRGRSDRRHGARHAPERSAARDAGAHRLVRHHRPARLVSSAAAHR